MTTLTLAAARSRTALVAALLAVACVAWTVTVVEMRGMDEGPWTSLGTPGWFAGVWITMMAAMMLPSAWPTIALHSRMGEARTAFAPLLFTAGYLAMWVVLGALAFAVAAVGAHVGVEVLAWSRGGRWVAAATLFAAAAYELTPAKRACLDRCRSPFGSLMDSWRAGPRGAVELGVRHGGWCVGCCWALMASLFALGVMSLVWTALIAVVIASQKLLERRRAANYATVALLGLLGFLMLVAPDRIPLLTIPV